jgi:hypothetical protein
MLFTMTNEDFDKLVEASKPVPLIMLQCGMPSSPYDRAMEAWKVLGTKMGFVYDTVRPFTNGNKLQFTAEPK